jgi:hypothetical protein
MGRLIDNPPHIDTPKATHLERYTSLFLGENMAQSRNLLRILARSVKSVKERWRYLFRGNPLIKNQKNRVIYNY